MSGALYIYVGRQIERERERESEIDGEGKRSYQTSFFIDPSGDSELSATGAFRGFTPGPRVAGP